MLQYEWNECVPVMSLSLTDNAGVEPLKNHIITQLPKLSENIIKYHKAHVSNALSYLSHDKKIDINTRYLSVLKNLDDDNKKVEQLKEVTQELLIEAETHLDKALNTLNPTIKKCIKDKLDDLIHHKPKTEDELREKILEFKNACSDLLDDDIQTELLKTLCFGLISFGIYLMITAITSCTLAAVAFTLVGTIGIIAGIYAGILLSIPLSLTCMGLLYHGLFGPSKVHTAVEQVLDTAPLISIDF